MAKKKIEDFEVEVKTKKVSVKAKKKGKDVEAEVKTPKAKVSVKKEGNKKEAILDTDKLDVIVTEENGEIKSEVVADNALWKTIGKTAVRIFSRNFRRNK